ncbi:MAG: cobalamin-binding protein [Burkholderiales bacterium]|nr:cobalamin-binding protein [Burkholderiales bacterium]
MSVYQRVVCLSTEAVEVMYALELEDLIVGISGYTTRPARARTEKTKVSGFSSAKLDRIMAVNPDVVIAYSNMQAEMCRELIAAGVEVHAYNQHTVEGIFRMITSLAQLFDKKEQGAKLVQELRAQMAQVAESGSQGKRRPRVYFEEWDEPMMTGIAWVSELIAVAGGEDIFADMAQHHHGRQRIIADASEVVRRAPDIIIGSWCGKKFRPETVQARAGWDSIPAVKNNRLYEIKSPDILSPGPAAIREGLLQLQDIVSAWQAQCDDAVSESA